MNFEFHEHLSHPLVAVFRKVDLEKVTEYVDQLVASGFPLIEVTVDSPEWRETAKKITAGGGIWGAGTVVSEQQVKEVSDAGAHFMMSPVCDSQVITVGARSGIPFIPGCMTPSEINSAIKAGASAVKIFPAVSIGTEGIASLRGPFPDILFIATGGVNLINAANYIKSGATLVGIGTSLFRNPTLVEAQLQAFRVAVSEI